MEIRRANNQDFEQIWPIFREIVAAGDTYAYPTDMSKEQALQVWLEVPRETYVFEVEGQILGTVNYMSPEQAEGKKIDARSDLFSLGVVLFTLLTGQRPYTGETMHHVTRKIVEEPPPIPSIIDEAVPAAFNPIVLKCMEKDPGKRYVTANELVGDLKK